MRQHTMLLLLLLRFLFLLAFGFLYFASTLLPVVHATNGSVRIHSNVTTTTTADHHHHYHQDTNERRRRIPDTTEKVPQRQLLRSRTRTTKKGQQQQQQQQQQTNQNENRLLLSQQQQQQQQQQKNTHKQKNRALQQAPSTGPVLNVLVCLLQWTNHPDRPATQPLANYEALLNGKGRDALLYPGGSAGAFFEAMSYGDFQINFIVTDWVETSYSEDFFTQDGSRGRTEAFQQAFTPVLQYLDDDFFDFSQVDSNFDRRIDLTLFLHSGYEGVGGGPDCDTGATATQRIASHARESAEYPTNKFLSATGYQLGAYAVAPAFRGVCDLQIGRIGVIVHEMIHTFGLPEMYDVEGKYQTGNIGGLDRFGVMANAMGPGNDLAFPGSMSAWTRLQFDWSPTPILITENGTYEARPVADYPDIYKITQGFANPKEYLLLENRQPLVDTFDEQFFDPGGMLIYHVDENIWDVFPAPAGLPRGQYPRGGPFLPGWPGNGKHYPVAMLQADGLYELEQGINGGQSKDIWNQPTQALEPGNGEQVVSNPRKTNYPNTDSYALGKITPTGIIIKNFQQQSNGVMTFQVCGFEGDYDCPDDTPLPPPPPSPETNLPTQAPTFSTTKQPTNVPIIPNTTPSPTKATTIISNTKPPTEAPTKVVIANTKTPTKAPTIIANTEAPITTTKTPTRTPTTVPSQVPTTIAPVQPPTPLPTPLPTTLTPTLSNLPSLSPSLRPTPVPTSPPTPRPTPQPTDAKMAMMVLGPTPAVSRDDPQVPPTPAHLGYVVSNILRPSVHTLPPNV